MGATTAIEIGGFRRRIGAWIVDRVLLTVVPLVVPLSAISEGRSWHGSLAVLTPQLPWIYTTIAHARFGRTVGKAAAGLAVVRADDGARIGLGRAIVRDLPKIAFCLSLGVLIPAMTVWGSPLADLGLESQGATSDLEDTTGLFWFLVLIVWAASAYLMWVLADAIAMVARPDRRSLHDLLAGTVVVTTASFSAPDGPSSSAPAPVGPGAHPERGW